VHVFSSASDAPRARRPTDVVLVVLALVTIGGMTLVAPGPGHLDAAAQEFIQALPGLLGWFWETAYDVLFVWAIVLIAIPIAARRRTRMLVGELLALGITFIVGSAVAGLAGVSGSESVRAIASSAPPARYPRCGSRSRLPSWSPRRRTSRDRCAGSAAPCWFSARWRASRSGWRCPPA